MEKDKIQSPASIAWKRFKKNRAGVISSAFIILCAFVAIFAYYIIPDDTPNANNQILEISTQKPGFSVDMLMIPKPNAVPKNNFWKHLIEGQPSRYRYVPYDSLNITTDNTTVYVFNPEPGSSQRIETIKNSELTSTHFINDEEARDYILNNNTIHKRFLLGTDQFGRDFLSRLLLGTTISLSVGFIAVMLSVVIGLFIGGIGGYFRGFTDDIIMWVINVVWSLPTLLVVIAITFVLGKGVVQVFIAVGFTMWVEVARVCRGQILSIRETNFVEAGRALGFKNSRIIIRHITPNILNPIIVISAANFATAILLEAGLSFLGIGVQPPMPSWGSMIKENYAYIILNEAYLAILPGLAIMILVLAFMLMGNALREALNNREI